jgi:translation initiation factor IF-2
MDIASPERVLALETFCRAHGVEFVAISAVTGQGIAELLERTAQCLERAAVAAIPLSSR